MMRNIIIVGVLALLGSAMSHAGMVRDGLWKIEKGDTLASVLNTILPTEPDRHARLARIARRLNKSSFDSQGELVVGQYLRLPGARIAARTNNNKTRIGKVVAAIGRVSAETDNGALRRLRRGSYVHPKDTLKTENAVAQVRFSDGSLLALRPNSAFKIEEYHYNGKQDGSERSFYNLLKGGFRKISGAIGKSDKNNYRVKTSVATLGIRGTHYGVTLCENGSCPGLEDGAYIGVAKGGISATNNTGEKIIGVDSFAYVASLDSPIEELLESPGIIFGNIDGEAIEEEQTDETDDDSEAESRDDEDLSEDTLGAFGDAELSARQEERSEENAQVNFSNRNRRQCESERSKICDKGLDRLVLFDLEDESLSPDNTDTRDNNGEVVDTDDQIDDNANLSSLNGYLHFASIDKVEALSTSSPTGIYVDVSGADVKVDDTGTVTTIAYSQERDSTLDAFQFSVGPDESVADSGVDLSFGVHWGRWDPVTSSARDAADSIRPRLHYIYTEQTILDLAGLQALANQRGFSHEVRLSYHNGTLPTDLRGNVGQINEGYIDLDLTTAELLDYYLSASIADATYTLTLSDRLDLGQMSRSADLTLRGECRGGACDTSTLLQGNASLSFITHDNELAALNSFSAFSDSNENVGIIGTALFTGDGSEQPIYLADGDLYTHIAGLGPLGDEFFAFADSTMRSVDQTKFSDIKLDSRGNIVSLNYQVDTVAEPFNFVAEDNTLSQTGERKVVSNGESKFIRWGRWQANSVTSLLDSGTANLVPGLHYIYTDVETLSPEELPGLVNNNDFGNTVKLSYLMGTAPTDFQGNSGDISEAYLELDLSTAELLDYYLRANIGNDIASDTYELELRAPVALNNMASSQLELFGTCSGQARCSQAVELEGYASLSLAFDEQDEALLGLSTLFAEASNGDNIGIHGALLFSGTQTASATTSVLQSGHLQFAAIDQNDDYMFAASLANSDPNQIDVRLNADRQLTNIRYSNPTSNERFDLKTNDSRSTFDHDGGQYADIVRWGRWNDPRLRQSDEHGFVRPALGHYIYSEADLANPGAVRDWINDASQGELVLHYAGGTLPTDIDGRSGSIIAGQTYMKINTHDMKLDDYSVVATFTSTDVTTSEVRYILSLSDSAVALDAISQLQPISLSGVCTGGNICEGEPGLQGVSLQGQASVGFVINVGDELLAPSSFTASGTNLSGDAAGISGAVLFSSNQQP